MADSGSVVVRWQLGRRLRVLRERARKTRADVVTARICSHTKLERIEYGQGLVRPGDVRELSLFYGADQEVVEVLVAMAYATTEPGWWERYSDAMRPDFGLYLALESSACELGAYEPDVAHGLLQCPSCARVVEEGTRLDATPEMIEPLVMLRQERQVAIRRIPNPLQVEIILHEHALLMMIDQRVMSEQITTLRSMTRQDHVNVLILPRSVGLTPATRGAFSILDVPDPEDPPVASVETCHGAH